MIFCLTSYFGPQVQKKAFIENTVPLIISLKSLLEQKRSPVLKDLMIYLQVRHAYICCMIEVGEIRKCGECANLLQLDVTVVQRCSRQVTMQDYRNEVKEFFSGDEQLAAEVEFALKTAEKDREVEKQMENCNLSGEPRTFTAQVRKHADRWHLSPPNNNCHQVFAFLNLKFG